MNQEFAIGHFLIGSLMLLISYFFAKYTPEKINNLFGYRTKRYMRNQDCWDFANRHSIRFIWKIPLITCVVQVLGVTLQDVGVALLTATIVLVTTLIYSIYVTEKALKNTFDKEEKKHENNLYWKKLLRAC